MPIKPSSSSSSSCWSWTCLDLDVPNTTLFASLRSCQKHLLRERQETGGRRWDRQQTDRLWISCKNVVMFWPLTRSSLHHFNNRSTDFMFCSASEARKSCQNILMNSARTVCVYWCLLSLIKWGQIHESSVRVDDVCCSSGVDHTCGFSASCMRPSDFLQATDLRLRRSCNRSISCVVVSTRQIISSSVRRAADSQPAPAPGVLHSVNGTHQSCTAELQIFKLNYHFIFAFVNATWNLLKAKEAMNLNLSGLLVYLQFSGYKRKK